MPLAQTMNTIASQLNFHDYYDLRRSYWISTKYYQSENLLFLVSVWDYSKDFTFGKKIEGISKLFLGSQALYQVNLPYEHLRACDRQFGNLNGGGARLGVNGMHLLEEIASLIYNLLKSNNGLNVLGFKEKTAFYMNPGTEKYKVKANWFQQNILRKEKLFKRTRAVRAHVKDVPKKALLELEEYFGKRPWLKQLQTLG